MLCSPLPPHSSHYNGQCSPHQEKQAAWGRSISLSPGPCLGLWGCGSLWTLLYCLSGLLLKERAVVPSFQGLPNPCHQQAAALVGWGGGRETDSDLSMGSGKKCLQLLRIQHGCNQFEPATATPASSEKGGVGLRGYHVTTSKLFSSVRNLSHFHPNYFTTAPKGRLPGKQILKQALEK